MFTTSKNYRFAAARMKSTRMAQVHRRYFWSSLFQFSLKKNRPTLMLRLCFPLLNVNLMMSSVYYALAFTSCQTLKRLELTLTDTYFRFLDLIKQMQTKLCFTSRHANLIALASFCADIYSLSSCELACCGALSRLRKDKTGKFNFVKGAWRTDWLIDVKRPPSPRKIQSEAS